MDQGKAPNPTGCRGCIILAVGSIAGVILGLIGAMGPAIVWLNNQPDIYRAMGKLIVAPHIANIVNDAYSDADPRFYATQTEILEGNILRGRVTRRLSHFQDRYGRLPDYKLHAELPTISSIFRVWVDSPNGEFARQFVDTLFDEFIKYKGEQKMGLSGSAMETFAREISKKAKELKIAEDELYQFQKKNPDVHLRREASAQNLPMVEKLTEYQKLLANVERTKKLYDEMVDQLSKINVSIDTTQVNMQIHEPAVLFSTPVSPNRRKTLLVAAVLGIGGGAGAGTLASALILLMLTGREKSTRGGGKPIPPTLTR